MIIRIEQHETFYLRTHNEYSKGGPDAYILRATNRLDLEALHVEFMSGFPKEPPRADGRRPHDPADPGEIYHEWMMATELGPFVAWLKEKGHVVDGRVQEFWLSHRELST